MEQSPSWQANRSSASQEIPHISWNPEVPYHIYKKLPPVPVPSKNFTKGSVRVWGFVKCFVRQ